MASSVLDLFTIGIGPSSSHTVGPMRAARRFALALDGEGRLEAAAQVTVDLFGSLGATGKGHGSDVAVMLGLEGEEPERVDPDLVPARVERVRREQELRLLGRRPIAFRPAEHVVFHKLRSLPKHPNGMTFVATDAAGGELARRTYYSVGGGFVLSDATGSETPAPPDAAPAPVPPSGPGGAPTRDRRVPHPFATGAELLAACAERGA